MNPKSLIAPVLTGCVVLVAAALYIKVIKGDLRKADDNLVTEQNETKKEKGRADAAETNLKTAKADKEAAEKSLTETAEALKAANTAKAKAENDLNEANKKVAELSPKATQVETLQASSAKLTKDLEDKNSQLADVKKKLGDAETQKNQAEGKLRAAQADLADAKRIADGAKDPGFLSGLYKANPTMTRQQIDQLLKEVPDLAAKLGGAATPAGADPVRQDMVERMVTLNIEGQFAYANDAGAPINEALTWSIGAVVIGMDDTNVYLIATPPPHLVDQPAARVSLTKNCTVYFSVHPAGWSGVRDPLPATFLGAVHPGNNAAVAVFAVPLAGWPQGREKPVALIPAPTSQECRQWTVNGDIGFIYSRGVPTGAGSGPVRMDAMLKVGEQDISLVLPAQAVGYELGLFGSNRAPSDKPILGVYYPEGNRILWLSDVYNGVKALAGDVAKRGEAGSNYVSADWVVTLGERPNERPVDGVITEFVNFIDKR